MTETTASAHPEGPAIDGSTHGRPAGEHPAAAPPAPRPEHRGSPDVSWRSVAGLNAANFFLAEVTGVTLPFVNDYLKGQGWDYTAIGIATGLAGLGVFLAQTPAGFLTDRVPCRRTMLAGASIMLGVCYGLLPVVPAGTGWVDSLLFVSGIGQAFFLPLLGALALGLVGPQGLNRMMGMNQSWNHAGNLAAAVVGLVVVGFIGVTAVFYAVCAVSILAAASAFVIRADEIDETRAAGRGDDTPAGGGKAVRFSALLADRRVLVLFVATGLFHLANAPVMPLVALDVKHLGGTDTQVACVVLVAQAVMIPVAWVTGWLCEHWGRKPVFAVGFAVLPVRIFLYAFAGSPWALIGLQAFDGIGAGIYGVAIVSVCSDLTRGKGGFNALSGVIATALSLGGVIGPFGAGWLVEHLGFPAAFSVFGGIAALAAVVFIGWMPETKGAGPTAAGRASPGGDAA